MSFDYETQTEQKEQTMAKVIFEISDSRCTQFITTHIPFEELKTIIQNFYHPTNMRSYLMIFNEYAIKIFNNRYNKCIHKPNISLSSSKIHYANDRWRVMEDECIIEKCRIDIAKTLIKHLTEFNGSSDCDASLTTIVNTLITSIEKLTEYVPLSKDIKFLHRSIKNIISNR